MEFCIYTGEEGVNYTVCRKKLCTRDYTDACSSLPIWQEVELPGHGNICHWVDGSLYHKHIHLLFAHLLFLETKGSLKKSEKDWSRGMVLSPKLQCLDFHKRHIDNSIVSQRLTLLHFGSWHPSWSFHLPTTAKCVDISLRKVWRRGIVRYAQTEIFRQVVQEWPQRQAFLQIAKLPHGHMVLGSTSNTYIVGGADVMVVVKGQEGCILWHRLPLGHHPQQQKVGRLWD